MADATTRRVRAASGARLAITVKVRFGDFRTVTRSATIDATDRSGEVARLAVRLVGELDLTPGVRLLGVSLANLAPEAARQLSFDDPEARPDEVDRVVDGIRDRFGTGVIGPASSLGPRGLTPKVRGAQAWGPD